MFFQSEIFHVFYGRPPPRTSHWQPFFLDLMSVLMAGSRSFYISLRNFLYFILTFSWSYYVHFKYQLMWYPLRCITYSFINFLFQKFRYKFVSTDQKWKFKYMTRRIWLDELYSDFMKKFVWKWKKNSNNRKNFRRKILILCPSLFRGVHPCPWRGGVYCKDFIR